MRSQIASTLQETLDEIVDDDLTNSESELVCPHWMKRKNMTDAMEEDQEIGGTGLASATEEGESMAVGSIQEGIRTRYFATKYTLRLIITEEAVRDTKYPRVLQLGKRLNKSIYQTMDYEMTNVLVRATNTDYVGGDNVPLASASHTLPRGGTHSNLLATGMAPSNLALETAVSQLKKFPGHNSLLAGVKAKKVVFPTEQWAAWERILGSPMDPTAGNFTAINVIKRTQKIEPVEVPHWQSTTVKWGIITDADNGLQYRVRDKPTPRTWVENSLMAMNHAVFARWGSGWSDWRGFLFSDA
jgi:hypothetical protein